MLGAIIGDIAGSYYEFLETNYCMKYKAPRPYEERIKIMDKKVPLISENSSSTDDSVLTTAIADALINGKSDYEKYLREYGLREIEKGLDKYGRDPFGPGFMDWVLHKTAGNSYGNGSAMRVSPIGYLNSLNDVEREVYKACIPTHNHPDAIKGAKAVAESIYYLRFGGGKEFIKKYIEKNYYDLNFDLEELRKTYVFSSKTIKTVPEAFYIFLISHSFEDALRKAISIGGDTDTIGAIVGALGEAYYGIDGKLYMEAKPYIKDYMWPIIFEFYNKGKVLKK